MNCLPLLYIMLLLDSVLGSLLAPVNVSVISHNFHHVLWWDPGPGTPPGTLYNIYSRVNKQTQLLNSTTTTSLKLMLNIYEENHLFVRASYNQTESQESKPVTFTPYKDTKIGPPEVSLAGCGNCIQINISLAKPDIRRGEGFHNDPQFRILWRKKKETKCYSYKTPDKSYILKDLEKGVEYCVQVHPNIRTNKNTLSSAWKCTFTSTMEPRRDAALLGAVAAVLIIVFGFLMTSIFCLYYSGFLCKLPATLPRALVMALRRGYTLTPEKTTPDLISISSEMEKHSNLTAPHPATRHADSEEEVEEEDEEGEEGLKVYMDRNAELSSGESSCRCSGHMLDISKPAASGDSGSFMETLSSKVEILAAEFEVGVVCAGLAQEEPKTEGATVSFMSEECQTRVQGHVTSEDEQMKERGEVCESSGNVNLFSVKLAALAIGEEEEQNTRDFLKPSHSDLLLQTISELTLSNTDPKMESDYEKTVESVHQHQDFTETGNKGRHADTQSLSEEEDKEEFSGYMAHT